MIQREHREREREKNANLTLVFALLFGRPAECPVLFCFLPGFPKGNWQCCLLLEVHSLWCGWPLWNCPRCFEIPVCFPISGTGLLFALRPIACFAPFGQSPVAFHPFFPCIHQLPHFGAILIFLARHVFGFLDNVTGPWLLDVLSVCVELKNSVYRDIDF